MTLDCIPSKEVSQPDVSALEIAANEYTEDVPRAADNNLKLFWLQVRYKRVNICKSQKEEKTDIRAW